MKKGFTFKGSIDEVIKQIKELEKSKKYVREA